MSRYKVWLKSVNSNTDLKRTALAISRLQKVSFAESVEILKSLPVCLTGDCSESTADTLFKGFRKLNAEVSLEELIVAGAPLKGKTPPTINTGGNKSIAMLLTGMVVSTSMLVAGGSFILSRVKPTPEQAEEMLAEGEFVRAEKAFRKEIGNKPHKADSYIHRAIALISQAREDLKKNGWANYGDEGPDKWQDPRLTEAMATLKKGKELFPKNPEMNRWMGYVYEQKSMFEEAEKEYREAVSKKPTELYWNLLGNLNVSQELYSKADFHFRKGLALAPKSPESLKNLAILHLYHSKLVDKALSYVKEINKLPGAKDFDIYTVRKDMVLLLWKEMMPLKSKLDFSEYEGRRKGIEARLKTSRTASALEEMGILFFQNHMFDASITHLKQAYEKKESDKTQLWLARSYMAKENLEMALRTWESMAKDKTNIQESYKFLALFSSLHKNDQKKALKYMEAYFKRGADHHKRKVYEILKN